MDYNLRINGVYWGYNHLLTIDPNFQRDIIVANETVHPQGWPSS